MKKIIVFIKDVCLWICTIFYTLTFYPLGYVLYYLSKIVRVVAFYLSLNPASARNELTGFWRMYRAIDDVMMDSSPKK